MQGRKSTILFIMTGKESLLYEAELYACSDTFPSNKVRVCGYDSKLGELPVQFVLNRIYRISSVFHTWPYFLIRI